MPTIGDQMGDRTIQRALVDANDAASSIQQQEYGGARQSSALFPEAASSLVDGGRESSISSEFGANDIDSEASDSEIDEPAARIPQGRLIWGDGGLTTVNYPDPTPVTRPTSPSELSMDSQGTESGGSELLLSREQMARVLDDVLDTDGAIENVPEEVLVELTEDQITQLKAGRPLAEVMAASAAGASSLRPEVGEVKQEEARPAEPQAPAPAEAQDADEIRPVQPQAPAPVEAQGADEIRPVQPQALVPVEGQDADEIRPVQPQAPAPVEGQDADEIRPAQPQAPAPVEGQDADEIRPVQPQAPAPAGAQGPDAPMTFLVGSDKGTKVDTADIAQIYMRMSRRIRNQKPQLADTLQQKTAALEHKISQHQGEGPRNLAPKEIDEAIAIFKNLGKRSGLPDENLRRVANEMVVHLQSVKVSDAQRAGQEMVYDILKPLDHPGAAINAGGSAGLGPSFDILAGLGLPDKVRDKFGAGVDIDFGYTRNNTMFPEDEALIVLSHDNTLSAGFTASGKAGIASGSLGGKYAYTSPSKDGNEVHLSTKQYAENFGFKNKAFMTMAKAKQAVQNMGKSSDEPAPASGRIQRVNSESHGLDQMGEEKTIDFDESQLKPDTFRTRNRLQRMASHIHMPGKETLAKYNTVGGYHITGELGRMDDIQQAAYNQEPKLMSDLHEHLGLDMEGIESLGAQAPDRKTPVLGKVKTHALSGSAAGALEVPGIVSFGAGATVTGQKTSVLIIVEDPIATVLPELEEIPEYRRPDQLARTDAFRQKAELIEPRISNLLIGQFPELGENLEAGQTAFDRASPEQLMTIIEEGIVADFENYSETVRTHDFRDKKDPESKAQKHQMESDWGVTTQKKMGLSSRVGRHGVIEAANVAAVSCGLAIRDKMSANGQGDRITAENERAYMGYQERVDTALAKLDKPAFKYDRKKMQASLSFERHLPINITSKKGDYSFEVRFDPSDNKVGGKVTVQKEAANFDHWSPYQDGVLHHTRITVPALISDVSFAALPEDLQSEISELGLAEQFESFLNEASATVGLPLPEFTIHNQRFDPNIAKDPEYPGEPGIIHDFTRITMKVGASAGGATKIPVAPFVDIKVSGDVGANASVMVKEWAGTDSLSYMFKRGSRMVNLGESGLRPDTATTGNLDRDKQLPSFYEHRKPQYVQIFSQMAEKGTKPFNEAFLFHIPEQTKRHTEAIESSFNRLEADGKLEPGEREALNDNLHRLRNSARFIINHELHSDTTEAADRMTPEQHTRIINEVTAAIDRVVAREVADYRAQLEAQDLGLSPEELDEASHELRASVKKLQTSGEELGNVAARNTELRARVAEYAQLGDDEKLNRFDEMVPLAVDLQIGENPYWQNSELPQWRHQTNTQEASFDSRTLAGLRQP